MSQLPDEITLCDAQWPELVTLPALVRLDAVHTVHARIDETSDESGRDVDVLIIEFKRQEMSLCTLVLDAMRAQMLYNICASMSR